MKKRNRILNDLRRIRKGYVNRFIDNTFDLSDRISYLLSKNKMTQKDLADKLNKKESEVSKWLSGTHNFTIKTISKIEDVFDEKMINVVSDKQITKRETKYIFINSNHVFNGSSLISTSEKHQLTTNKPRFKRISALEC